MANLPSLAARLAYIMLFSLGSIVGMAALTTFAAWQLTRFARGGRLARALAIVTGSLSLGLGGWWGWAATSSLLYSVAFLLVWLLLMWLLYRKRIFLKIG